MSSSDNREHDPAQAPKQRADEQTMAEAQSEEPVGSKRRKPRDHALLIVVTGTGKGKSSSAFGMMLRSWARGYKIGVFQFVKSGKWKVGEHKAAMELGGITWEKMGDGWTWISKDLDESADLAREGWSEVKRRIADESFEFLLLDELTYAMNFGWIDTAEVVETLVNRPGFQHVIVTGRDAPQELIDAADLVSEIKKVKHPYDAGIRGQQGIEW